MGRASHTATPERKPQRLECCCSHVAILALARLAGIVYALLRDGSERKADRKTCALAKTRPRPNTGSGRDLEAVTCLRASGCKSRNH
jgi:hypothetical protein